MHKRLIKKYANRRLYDTEESRYVTLEDIRALIAMGIDVEVHDETKDEDITRGLLLQIVSEQEYAGRPVLNEQFLTHLIRFYGHPMQDFMGEYLAKSVRAFMSQQQTMQEQFDQALSAASLETMREFAGKNLETWMKMQQAIFNPQRHNDKTGDRRDSD